MPIARGQCRGLSRKRRAHRSGRGSNRQQALRYGRVANRSLIGQGATGTGPWLGNPGRDQKIPPCLGPFPLLRPMPPSFRRGRGIGKVQQPVAAACWSTQHQAPQPARRASKANSSSLHRSFKAPASVANQVEGMVPRASRRSGHWNPFTSAAAAGRQPGSRAQDHLAVTVSTAPSRPSIIPNADRSEIPINQGRILEENHLLLGCLQPRGWRSRAPARSDTPQGHRNPDQPRCRAVRVGIEVPAVVGGQ